MLNDNIKKLRIARGLTQVELASALGVSKQCVSNWENDYIQPSIEMLVKISKYFKTTTDYLLGLQTGTTIDASELTDAEAAHIRLLIEDIACTRKCK